MSTRIFILKVLLAICCFAYICLAGGFIGLANDYETLAHGLIPVIAFPAALVMAIMAFISYRLTFQEVDEGNDNLDWPIVSLNDEEFHH